MDAENQYAVDPVALETQPRTGFGLVIAMVLFCSFLIAAILVPLCRSSFPPKPRFKYLDHVEVTSGFLEGLRGQVEHSRFDMRPMSIDGGVIVYWVRVEGKTHYEDVDESDLRKLEDWERITVTDYTGKKHHGRALTRDEVKQLGFEP